MSLLFYKMSTAILSIVVLFIYIVVFALKPSQQHETALIHASNIRSSAGLSLASSPYYKANDFYLGIAKDDYMSFTYVK